ncbi:hypothetical protein JCM30760_18670 [Thiomicrorhabdus hydrogeniphila]
MTFRQLPLLGLFFFCAVLLGCAGVPSVSERQNYANVLVKKNEWHKQVIRTKRFDLIAFLPNVVHNHKSDVLTVYIEGDGLAWISPNVPSHNPTPINPLALKLAINDSSGNVAYLARPCQFVESTSRNCESKLWKEARFSTPVIEAMNQAVQQLKEQTMTKKIRLIGYSGGGAIATLLAEKRKDIEMLITVAGTLDHRAWTHFHKISPLTQSLNPIDEIHKLKSIPQVHFIGSADRIIPKSITESFVQEAIKNEIEKITVREIPGYTHVCCWVGEWRALQQSLESHVKKEFY